MGALDSFLNEEEHKSDTKASGTIEVSFDSETKKRLSKAKTDYQAVKSQNTTVWIIAAGLIIIGVILIFTAEVDSFSIPGLLLFLAGGVAQLFRDEEKPKELEIKIKVLEMELAGKKRRKSEKIQSLDRASTLLQEGGLANLQKVLKIYSRYGKNVKGLKKEIAQEKEELLDYDAAIRMWEELGENKEAARVRKLKANLAAPKTEIHGDYVDDRDTIIKDSVISKSNVGAGGDDKFTKLKELTEMKEKGLIDDDEYKQMKKEILGK